MSLWKCMFCIVPYRKWTKTGTVWSLLMNSSFPVKRYSAKFIFYVVIIKPFPQWLLHTQSIIVSCWWAATWPILAMLNLFIQLFFLFQNINYFYYFILFFKGVSKGLHCPLVVNDCASTITVLWQLFSVVSFWFFCLLCAGWKHHEVSSALWKCHLNNWHQSIGKRENGDQNKPKWNKEGYKMGPFDM